MDHLMVLVLAAVTSLGAGLVAARRFGLSGAALLAGGVEMLEHLGAAVVFYGLNLVVGAGVVVALRLLTPMHPSLYPLNDVSLLVLSLIQGVTFERWRARAAVRR